MTMRFKDPRQLNIDTMTELQELEQSGTQLTLTFSPQMGLRIAMALRLIASQPAFGADAKILDTPAAEIERALADISPAAHEMFAQAKEFGKLPLSRQLAHIQTWRGGAA